MKPTSSANRGKRKSTKPVTTSKGRANRSSVSTARVSESGKGVKGGAKVTQNLPKLPAGKSPKGALPAAKAPKAASKCTGGLLGERTITKPKGQAPKPVGWGGSPKLLESKDGAPKVKLGPKGSAPSKLRAPNRPAAAAKSVVKAAGKSAVKGALKKVAPVAAAAAVMAPRPVADGTLKGKGVKNYAKRKASKAEAATNESFDKSFAQARANGSKEFMWKGKRYTTKLA